MRIWSDEFSDGEVIPRRLTCEGDDVSPSLAWDDSPSGTREFALSCLDPDATSLHPWVHWLVYKIGGEMRSLTGHMPPLSRVESPFRVLQGRNSWSTGRTIGYRGPAPPLRHGIHRYVFTLYALDSELSLFPGIDHVTLFAALKGHVLAEVSLVGTFER